MSKSIKFEVIQSGYCVFGAGYTERGALIDACKWLEPIRDEADPNFGERWTPARLAEHLSPRHNHVDGDMIMIDSDDEEGMRPFLTSVADCRRYINEQLQS